MSLADYVVPTRDVDIPGVDKPMRLYPLSLQDCAEIISEHLKDEMDLSTLLQGNEERTLEMLLAECPEVIAKAIARACRDEHPHHSIEKLTGLARDLPLQTQFTAMMNIASMTVPSEEQLQVFLFGVVGAVRNLRGGLASGESKTPDTLGTTTPKSPSERVSGDAALGIKS